MTTTRYIIVRIIKSFGLVRRQKKLFDIAVETHLLKDGEFKLGSETWHLTENIEDISLEYWNLRQLNSEKEKIEKRLDQYEEQIVQAHEERAQTINQKSQKQADLEDEHDECLRELDTFTRERDEIIDEARNLRRQYDAAKTKLEVVEKEHQPNDSSTADTRAHMNQVKGKIESLKKQRDQAVKKIEQQDRQLDQIESQINAEQEVQQKLNADSLQKVRDLNKKISTEKAELGLIESQMHGYFTSIGRHVSRYADIDPDCRKATANHRALVDVMKALRLSIQLNYKLLDH